MRYKVQLIPNAIRGCIQANVEGENCETSVRYFWELKFTLNGITCNCKVSWTRNLFFSHRDRQSYTGMVTFSRAIWYSEQKCICYLLEENEHLIFKYLYLSANKFFCLDHRLWAHGTNLYPHEVCDSSLRDTLYIGREDLHTLCQIYFAKAFSMWNKKVL